MDYSKLQVHSKLVTKNKKNRKQKLGNFMGRTLEIK